MRDFEQQHLDRILAATTPEGLLAEQGRIREQMAKETLRLPGDSIYPAYAGFLTYMVTELRRIASELDAKCEQVKHKEQAFSWAAECTLTEKDENGTERWETFYTAVDIIEKALRDGMTYDQLREHLKDGVTPQEIEQKRLLNADELCTDCGEYIGEGIEGILCNKCAACGVT